jgi:glutamate-1-semialdehyde 2,1-aminomutase
MFLCAAMTEADIDLAVAGADRALARVRANAAALTPHPIVAQMLGGH